MPFGPEFDALCAEFLRRSGDKERTVESIKKQIREVGNFWTLKENGQAVGYFFAEIMPTEYDTKVCLIHQVVIRSGNRSHLAQVDRYLEKWARARGAAEMAFYTRRNAKAFLRTLKNGWEVDSVVLKRKI